MDIKTQVGSTKRTPVQTALLMLFALAVAITPLVFQGLGQFLIVRVLALVGIYVMLALGLNIVVGYAGLLDLGYIAFYAMGAYASAILGVALPDLFKTFTSGGLLALLSDGTWIWLLPVAALCAAITGIALGTPVLRLRGDYLAIVTLGFGEIVRILANNDFLKLTNGAKGLPRVNTFLPPPLGLQWLQDNLRFSLPGFDFAFSPNLYWYYVVVILCIFTVFIIRRLDNSRLGRSWVAMREDEVAAASIGVNIRGAKLWAFSLGAVWGGIAGVAFTNFQGFVSPESFTFMESVFVVCMVVLGGMGSIPGAILGAAVITGVPELLRAVGPMLGLPAETIALVQNYRYMVFGLLMVVMMAVRPQGMIPSKRRALELHPDDAKIRDEESQSLWEAENKHETSAGSDSL
jgi:branched-chain amino acid transport system permease protein